MALTKPRAYQIYDIDYKQATRVITVANVTLSGGAPSQVDGVNLSLNDRVLVTGQTNKAQNGIYDVDTVGSGANGTWVRSGDTNTTGELLAGTIVMVTEGVIYADTQWKLTTNDPIVIGVSELIFEQNSAFAFGNVYANSTAVLASSVGDVLTLSPGNNISITGNNTSKTVTIGVTGISLNSISNGTSNVNVVSSGGNVTVGVAGTNNVAVFGTSQTTFAGNILPSANITYSLGSSTQRWKDLWVSNSTIYLGEYALTTTGNALVFNNQIVITANSTSPVVTTGNITGGNLLINGSAQITGNLSVLGTETIFNVANLTVNDKDIIVANNVSDGANVDGAGIQAGNPGVATWFFNNVTTSWQSNIGITPTANGTLSLGGSSNYWGSAFVTTISATGNANVGNIGATNAVFTNIAGTLTTAAQTNITSVGTLGSLSVTGNTTSGNFVGILNGSGANVTSISATNISSGTLAQARLANSAVTLGNTALTLGATVTTVTGLSSVTSTTFVGTLTGAATTAGTVTTAAQPNITSVGTLSSVTVTANVAGGNLTTAGQVTATGNITGGNLLTSGNIVDTGAISIITGASGNVNLAPNGSTVLVATTTGANVTGTLGVTGNITGGNILGNGAGLTGINAFSNVSVTGGNSAVADSISDTLTLTAGTGISIVIDSTTDTITIATQGGSEIFVDGADFGTVTEPVTVSDDLGLVTETVEAEADLGALVTSGLIYPDQFVLPSYTTTTLPSASIAGAMIYVTNETGGAVPAFSDGTNWRRVTDRAIVS